MIVKQKYIYKIELVTGKDVLELTKIASRCDGDVMLVSDSMKLNAKSFLGAHLARMAWDEIYLETDNDHYNEFQKFIVE